MNIERWIGGCYATAQDWYDKKNIYFGIEYYRPGQARSAGPVWSKSFLIPIEEEQKIRNYFDSIARGLMQETDERRMLSWYQNGKQIVQNGRRIA